MLNRGKSCHQTQAMVERGPFQRLAEVMPSTPLCFVIFTLLWGFRFTQECPLIKPLTVSQRL